MKPKLIVILGPTAVGKTALSVELAAALDGEIISGDSMQVYRYLDIGTAKIRPEEKIAANGKEIPHHLIDILNPDEPYTVADFQKAAATLVSEINERGKIPILAGGTGLYVSALIYGYTFSENEGEDTEFRRRKQREFREKGGAALLKELAAVDAVTAARTSPSDGKRIIRALEVYHLTGKPLSAKSEKNPPDWDIRLIGLTRERAQLYERINQRVLQMLADGLEEEVRGLLAAGWSPQLKPMRGLGYKQMCEYLMGNLHYEEMVELIQRDTRRFAKRQLTWWRREPDIHWFDLTKVTAVAEILPEILALCQ